VLQVNGVGDGKGREAV